MQPLHAHAATIRRVSVLTHAATRRRPSAAKRRRQSALRASVQDATRQTSATRLLLHVQLRSALHATRLKVATRRLNNLSVSFAYRSRNFYGFGTFLYLCQPALVHPEDTGCRSNRTEWAGKSITEGIWQQRRQRQYGSASHAEMRARSGWADAQRVGNGIRWWRRRWRPERNLVRQLRRVSLVRVRSLCRSLI